MKKSYELIDLFRTICRTEWSPSRELVAELDKYLDQFSNDDFVEISELTNKLIYLVNSRLEINNSLYREFINTAANNGVIFNYHEKLNIEEAISQIDVSFSEWFKDFFKEASVLFYFSDEIEKKRNKELACLDVYLSKDKNKDLAITSIFCSFIFFSVKIKEVHRKLNSNCNDYYLDSFFGHLEKHHSNQINRKNGLAIIDMSGGNFKEIEYPNILSMSFAAIHDIYESLDNHSYLSIIIDEAVPERWKLVSDISIYAEKFIERDIEKTFFRKKEIFNRTNSYIKSNSFKESDFQLANEGFHYKDCYVTYDKNNQENIVLIFEKNERDEKIIPCPKCRTMQVQGNSYPILGVKSWECKNTFCGDKSKYNRGKRYSLSSIVRQQAIFDDRNIIPKPLLKRWRRDVVYNTDHEEIIEFLILFYSLYGDTVNYYSLNKEAFFDYGRTFKRKNLELDYKNNYLIKEYESNCFFKRFMIDRREKSSIALNISDIDNVKLYNGDSFEILSCMDSNSISGAVTSPPYYNAREYSTWPNIYCYLYDMYNIARQIYRVLKDGSPFIFNIFDYFDNENNIVLSAMGKKRLILSSYISYIFRKIGFKHLGNCAWDKGEIQGNRNFNHGNISPYYQAPHNCWEHLMIFSKGEPKFDKNNIPKVILERPVFKMNKGVNTHGHTAPYPGFIPNILINLIKYENNPVILDPFSGSMTTGYEAYKSGIKSVNIELHEEYCELSMKILKKNIIMGNSVETNSNCLIEKQTNISFPLFQSDSF